MIKLFDMEFSTFIGIIILIYILILIIDNPLISALILGTIVVTIILLYWLYLRLDEKYWLPARQKAQAKQEEEDEASSAELREKVKLWNEEARLKRIKRHKAETKRQNAKRKL